MRARSSRCFGGPPTANRSARSRAASGTATLVAIGVLLVTGAAMASHFHRWGDGTLHVKLVLVAAVAVLVLWHMRRPELHAVEGLVFLLSLAIVWLGLSIAH